MRIPVLSFFTGGGFLDMGFEEVGFDIAWTNEVNPSFARMYGHAMTAWRQSKLAMAPPARIASTDSVEDLSARRVLSAAFGKTRPAFFGVVGGPPCPDFSFGGRHTGAEGAHGRLTRTFVDLACAIRPEFVLMENVPGLLRARKHRPFLEDSLARLEDAGYAVDVALLNALELGVPQDRERLFVIAFRRRSVQGVLGRPMRRGQRGWFEWPKDPRYTGAKSLPWPATNGFGKPVERPEGIPSELMVYSVLTGVPPPEALPNGCEYFQPKSPKFRSRAEGDVSHKSFKRLHRFRYSPAAWYGNNEVHLHPWKPRRLSVREALRIQSVPDEYVLPPECSLTAKFKMIANGVPFRMARQVAQSVAAFCASAKKARSAPHSPTSAPAATLATAPSSAREVAQALRSRYRDFSHHNKANPLAELLFIICSVQTDEQKYQSTYSSLRRAYPTFAALSAAPPNSLARVLERGGLSRQKSIVISEITSRIVGRFGRPSLVPLRQMSDADCEEFLTSLPGVGKKTARCVMMYSLNRQVFPVDTHCWRICRRLGWVRRTRPNGSCSPRDMDRLQAKIPPDLRFSLHVNMVSLGRQICRPTAPLCSDCLIARYCRRIGVH